MDASAYLCRQGWLGLGYSLHPNGHGISRPILVSKKSNKFGVGLKQNDAQADQWWARVFDNKLESLQVATDESTVRFVPQKSDGEAPTSTSGPQIGARWGTARGLYEIFTKGEGLAGTLRSQMTEQPETRSSPQSKTVELSDRTLDETRALQWMSKETRKSGTISSKPVKGDTALKPSMKHVVSENIHSRKRNKQMNNTVKVRDRSRKSRHLLVRRDDGSKDAKHGKQKTMKGAS